MENASKALLIAGAILIVILLIAVGMLVYSKSRGVVDTGIAQMSSAEINMFNAIYQNYEGLQNGKTVGKLLEQIKNHNVTYKDDKSRWVLLEIHITQNPGPGARFDSNSNWASQANIVETMQDMIGHYYPFIANGYKNQGSNSYDVSLLYENGLVRRVIIKQQE
ncbi:MAG: hypothetical protein E7310_02555 [Clostridiales bacterium]|nr:hypothetical protein [Clostridiales bacterium]